MRNSVNPHWGSQILTLTSVLDRTVRLFGDRPAILDTEGSFTWRRFADRVARAGGVLGYLGIKSGERYGIVCRNSFRNAELMHAGYWIGAVPVPANYRLAPPEIAYIFDNAECKLVIVEDAFEDLIQAPELAPWADGAMVIGRGHGDPSRPNYEAMVARTEPASAHDCAEDDDAVLLYTGGTTGRGKGVRLSHRNVVSNGLQVGFECGARPDDIYLHVAPMFHSADLFATAYTIAGAAHAFMPQFSGRAVLEAIQTQRITATMMTPTMLIMTMEESDFDTYDISSLRYLLYGSSPMAAEWIRRMLDRFKGVEIVQGYGLTETSPILTLLHMADHEAAVEADDYEVLKSVGRPLPGVDMRIVGVDGRDMPAGEPGEIVVRAPNVAVGYLKRPEENEAAFRHGWFYTGDIGYMDEHGYLYLLDRKKDMIITGGENVYSLEVEAALYQNPKVHECAVIGVPDETYGEALLAAVVPAPGASLTDEELIAHCRGRIGGYKIPRRYVFLDQLPKSAMNKILKNELRRLYGETVRAKDES